MRPDRHQFVGIALEDGLTPLHSGGHLTTVDGNHSEGYVTSAAYSPTLDRYIGLGLLKGGRQRLGENIQILDCGQRRGATVVDPVHVDPTGERLNG